MAGVKEGLGNKHNRGIFFLCVAIILLFYVNFNLASRIYKFEARGGLQGKNIEFELISERVALMDVTEFLESQKRYNLNYRALKEQVRGEIQKYPLETYAFYFEDLSTGAWTGIDEKKKICSHEPV